MMRSVLLAGSFLIGTLMLPVAAQADSPRRFLEKALKGDNSEIMLGRMAANRAGSSGVRDFGRTLVSDHRHARDQVLNVGQRFGLNANHQPTREAQMERDRLSGMRGGEFDREFVHYMVNDHRKDIADFRDEAREHHGAVSNLAGRQLPELEKHLQIAMSLERGNDRLSRNYQQDRNRDYNQDRNYDRNNGR